MTAATAGRQLAGICENMPPEARAEREEILLELIRKELEVRGGSGGFDSVLWAVAAEQRIAISQLKHGLNRGIALGSLEVTADSGNPRMLIVSTAARRAQ